MSTRKETVAALIDTLAAAGRLTSRAMFGEYALYLDGTVVAFVCDDTLFVKPTPGALAALPDAPMAPAYPGSKDYIRADAALDDPDSVIAALRAAARDAPPPKPKRRKAR